MAGIRMPNGQLVSIHEVYVDALYSAMIIEAGSSWQPQWEPFDYGLAQAVTRTRHIATRAYTNIPRQGYAGLPMGYEFWIRRWRVQTNIRFAEPVLNWAAETSIVFRYNDKAPKTSPLLDLMMAPQPFEDITDDGQITGFLMRENLSYRCEVQCPQDSFEKLQHFLVEHTEGKLILWVYLEGLLRKDIQ